MLRPPRSPLSLNQGQEELPGFRGEGRGRQHEPTKSPLSEVIQLLNERFGTALTSTDELYFQQIVDSMASDEQVAELARANTIFVDRRGAALTGSAVRKLFDRLKVRTGIPDLCAHMLRHTWATLFNRSASGSRFDLQVEGGWTTGRMVDRYCKARPFEERRRAPSPFTAWRAAVAGKGPGGKRPPQQVSVLGGERSA